MKITCNTKELSRCLKTLNAVPGSKIWVKATAKSVKLLSESTMIAMSLSLPDAVVQEAGIACLWHNDFIKIIGTSYKRKVGNVSISSEDKSVTIEMSGVVYTLPLLDDEVPVIRRKARQVVKLELREPFLRLKKFMNREKEYRPTLNGIYLDSTHALKAVATDGRILKALSVKGGDPPEGFGSLIPYQACVLLMDKAWDGEIAANQDEQMMWFSKPGMVMSINLTNREYVSWQGVIAKALVNTIHITVDRKQLIDAVKLVDRINFVKRAPIVFELIEGIIVISSGLDDKIATTSIGVLNPCHVTSLDPTAVVALSDEVTFHLSKHYILTCLKSIVSDEVTLRVKDNESEIYLSGGSDEQTVIMTMKVR